MPKPPLATPCQTQTPKHAHKKYKINGFLFSTEPCCSTLRPAAPTRASPQREMAAAVRLLDPTHDGGRVTSPLGSPHGQPPPHGTAPRRGRERAAPRRPLTAEGTEGVEEPLPSRPPLGEWSAAHEAPALHGAAAAGRLRRCSPRPARPSQGSRAAAPPESTGLLTPPYAQLELGLVQVFHIVAQEAVQQVGHHRLQHHGGGGGEERRERSGAELRERAGGGAQRGAAPGALPTCR